jgi:hypothetical protein
VDFDLPGFLGRRVEVESVDSILYCSVVKISSNPVLSTLLDVGSLHILAVGASEIPLQQVDHCAMSESGTYPHVEVMLVT